MLQQLNILSRKQAKYCRKLTRLNNIMYACRILFASAREQQCNCDVAYSSAIFPVGEIGDIFPYATCLECLEILIFCCLWL